MTSKEAEFTLNKLKMMRTHFSAVKEKLCNQRRWEEALEYQVIQDKLELIIREVEKETKNEID